MQSEDVFDSNFTLDESITSKNFDESGKLETYGEDLKKVREILEETPNRVWTLVENDEGEVIIQTGYVDYGAIYHMITEEEWEEEASYFVTNI